MKYKHKIWLKSIFLSSLASLGSTPVNTQAAVVSSFSKKENESEVSEMAETLNNSVLSSSIGSDDTRAHSSHQSHSSHSSHQSHSSSSGGSWSSEGGNVNMNEVGKVIGYTALGVAATAGVVYIVKAIKTAHTRNAYYRKANAYKNTLIAPVQYGTRKITARSIGRDVDEMIDSLVANGALNISELEYRPSKLHYKYNRAVKRGVKEMYRRMGQKPKRYATIRFLYCLKSWKSDRHNWESKIGYSSIPIDDCNIIKALAALLLEKNYLQEYNVDIIMKEEEMKKILDAYHVFQKEYGIPESNQISLRELSLLYKTSSLIIPNISTDSINTIEQDFD